jgi:hypothetical protein
MSKLRLNMMMSLDGYTAGPEQSAENPLVPVLLGGGTRLFENLGPSPRRPQQVEVVEAPGVTHLRYRLGDT